MKQKKLARSVCGTAVAALIAAALTSAPARAEQVINLTAIDGYPTKASWVREFINFYIPAIDKALAKGGKYKIKWNQAFGGAIVKPKGVFKGLQTGLGDIGVVTTVFHHDKVPLQAIAYVTPFTTTDSLLMTRTVDKMAKKFPAMAKAFAQYDQVYLTNLVVIDTYQLYFKKPLSGLKDLKGRKIGGAGINLRYVKALGAVGVGGPLPKYYNMIKTGIVDGAMLWPEAAVSFKVYEVAPHMLDAQIGAVNSKVVTVNAATWKKLPAEVRAVLAEQAIRYRDHMAKVALRRGRDSYGTFKKKGGTIVKLAAEDRLNWARTMPNIAKEWAERLDKKGLPGTALLKAYMAEMRNAKQPIARQWDQQ
ncbi:MAG: C4-dicarboxylate TRAP transporter substrate-binding protein [Alphaproteobacteria bacterium]|nr:C4-dicarboxylate TRAP transporter substrate-binding protein [Alphaproteobacteria bacterium]